MKKVSAVLLGVCVAGEFASVLLAVAVMALGGPTSLAMGYVFDLVVFAGLALLLIGYRRLLPGLEAREKERARQDAWKQAVKR